MENSYRKQKKVVHSLFFHALWAVLLTLVLLSGMTGCAREEKEDSGLLLYYLNEDLSSLNTLSYLMKDGKSKADLSPQEMADDMLEQLATPSGDVRSIAPIQNFTVTGTTLQNGTLTVFLSSDYEELETVREILTRAALVNTLCQIDGVDSVSFLCGDHPLTNEDGSVVTAMNSDMFIFNSGKEIMNYEKVRLHLYFANEDGDQLVDTYRNVVYNSNISMERLVVEQVLKGPNSDVVFPTLNPASKVLSVTTRDGVCYVNLDQAFLTEPYGVSQAPGVVVGPGLMHEKQLPCQALSADSLRKTGDALPDGCDFSQSVIKDCTAGSFQKRLRG